jgi:hypothetical protein
MFFSKYTKGQFVQEHTDSFYLRSENERTFLSVLAYLTDNPTSGATAFLTDEGKAHTRIYPVAGIGDCGFFCSKLCKSRINANIRPQTETCWRDIGKGYKVRIHFGRDLRENISS